MTKKGYQKRLPKVPAPPRPPVSPPIARTPVPPPTRRPTRRPARPAATPPVPVSTTPPATPPTTPQTTRPSTPPAARPADARPTASPTPPPSVPAPRASSERVAQPRVDEAGTPPVPAPAPSARRFSRAAVVGLVAVGLANLLLSGLIGYLVVSSLRDDAAPRRGPGAAGGGAGADPPGLPPADESYVETVVQPDGQVVVQQWIRTDAPLRRLRLALPPASGASALSASRIEVVADGLAAAGPKQITDRAAIYTFPPTTEVEVTYRILGAVTRSASAPGRALAHTTALDVTYSPRAEHETRVVRAAEVLALACSTTAQETPTPCGEDEGDGQWRVELDGPSVDDRVMAQLTLG